MTRFLICILLTFSLGSSGQASKCKKLFEQEKVPGEGYLKIAKQYEKEGLPLEANKWLKKASDAGSAQAMYQLAIDLLLKGGTYRAGREAIKYLAEASKLGHAKSQVILGDIYLRGEFKKIKKLVRINYKKARKLFQQASAQKNEHAEFALKMMNEAGLGLD